MQTGWKPIPLTLKILFVLLILWAVGSAMNLPVRFVQGLPLFGIFVSGIPAAATMLVLDILGPGLFLLALWTRRPWGPVVAYAYMGVFILNGVVAFLTVQKQLGLAQIAIPVGMNAAFLLTVFLNRRYFESERQG